MPADAACAPLVAERLRRVLLATHHDSQQENGTSATSPQDASLDEIGSHFHHTVAPTLAHLLPLFMRPPASFPPPNTSLVIIDSLSTLIDNAYPRNVEGKNKNDQTRWAAGRRFTVINELISTFSRFAALHNVALLVTCQTITRIRGASRALLVPAISGVEWENGISTRLVLFRDWIRQGRLMDNAESDRLRKVRFAGLLKLNGIVLADEGSVGSIASFAIENVSQSNTRRAYAIEHGRSLPAQDASADSTQSGICDLSITSNNIGASFILPVQARPLKRPFDEVDEDAGEEPTSDELYGWIEDDQVAAEGLLIDETEPPITEPEDTAGSRSPGRSTKMTRPSTL